MVRKERILYVGSGVAGAVSSGQVAEHSSSSEYSVAYTAEEAYVKLGEEAYDAVLVDKEVVTELFNCRSRLEALVEERTCRLMDEIESRRRAEERLRITLRDKDILFREVHHRVKNNLQVVSSLLRLQAERVSDDDKAREMFHECQKRVRSISLVHEHLYSSPDSSSVCFRSYAMKLVYGLFKAYGVCDGRIRLVVDGESVALGIDMAVPCGLILNELVSNALKYAFPEGCEGEITMSIKRTPDSRMELLVTDNGIGLPEDFDFRLADTLGLQIVAALSEQLNGNYRLYNSHGTVFRFSFPLPAS
ncbi:MAG: sensor histidine kinase [Nitrospirae bacterium]|nr:sensor histidine kinase [Nitrospirota bacterium]